MAAKVDVKTLKSLIIQDDLVVQIFEALEIDKVHVEQGGRLVVGQLPSRFNSQNSRAVQTKLNDGLTSYIRNRNDFKGDLFDLISYIQFDARGEDLHKTFFNSVDFVKKTLGINGDSLESMKPKVDYASPLKRLKKLANRKNIIKPNPPIPEYYLDDYDRLYPQSWINEGISFETMEHFGIRADSISNRIVIPYRNRRGQLVGTKGRLFDDSEQSDFNPKYKYIDILNASQELFNFHEAKDLIKKEKRVFIFEGEKSVMKMWQAGVLNCVAMASSDFSETQLSLVHSCGSNVDLIFCYDNDKTTEEIKEVIDKISAIPMRNNDHDYYAIYDTNELLPPKSSPIDGGIEIFNQLFEENCYNVG